MPAVLRGQIRWADLDPVQGHEQAGRRPVLVISSFVSNDRTRLAIILPITSAQPRVGYPYAVPIASVRMPKPSWILTRQIRTVAASRMGDLIGRVSNDEMQRISEAVLHHILPPGSQVTIGVFRDLV